jgi:cation:H+ antiporter
MEYLLSALGFLILLGSGHFLVRGSVSLSQYFKVSKLVIGLTVVAFGTSAPELIISLQSAIKGHPEIAIGNVIGSNISNIALVLAIAAIVSPIRVKQSSIKIDWSVMMGVSLLFYLFILNGWLSRFEGFVFITLLTAYILFHLRKSKNELLISLDIPEIPKFSLPVSIIVVIIACVGLIAGAHLLIENAVIVATNLGMSERAISVSLIAVGTSLPELSTSIIAAYQKESDISVGNILGSNIFNILSVLGFTAIVKPIEVSPMLRNFDTLWMLGIGLLFFIVLLPMRKKIITPFNGLFMLSVYSVYIYLVVTLAK